MNLGLLQKVEKDKNFKKQMQKAEETYSLYQQLAKSANLSSIPNQILKHVESRNIFLYFGALQPTSQAKLSEVSLFLAKQFNPPSKSSYTLVFLNQFCKDNYAFWNFREILCRFPLHIVSHLKRLIIVKPSQYHKMLSMMPSGTVSTFVKSCTYFINTYQQLCTNLGLTQNFLFDHIPKKYLEKQFAHKFQQLQPLLIKKQSVKQQVTNKYSKNIKNIRAKMDNEVNLLQDFQISENGVPTILQMFVHYFEQKQIYIEREGLFRRNASIIDEEELINKIAGGDYDCIMEVTSPHIIANLIKKMFASLKVPIFPFHLYDKIQSHQNANDMVEFLTSIVKDLPELNRTTLMFIISFLKKKVIAKEQINKMGEENIGICFSPCFFRSRHPSIADLKFAPKGVMYTRLMLKEFQKIFGSQEEQIQCYQQNIAKSFLAFENNLNKGLELTQKIVSSDSQQNSKVLSAFIKPSSFEGIQNIQEINIEENFEDIMKEGERNEPNQLNNVFSSRLGKNLNYNEQKYDKKTQEREENENIHEEQDEFQQLKEPTEEENRKKKENSEIFYPLLEEEETEKNKE